MDWQLEEVPLQTEHLGWKTEEVLLMLVRICHRRGFAPFSLKPSATSGTATIKHVDTLADAVQADAMLTDTYALLAEIMSTWNRSDALDFAAVMVDHIVPPHDGARQLSCSSARRRCPGLNALHPVACSLPHPLYSHGLLGRQQLSDTAQGHIIAEDAKAGDRAATDAGNLRDSAASGGVGDVHFYRWETHLG
jgi:hypothetical protein